MDSSVSRPYGNQEALLTKETFIVPMTGKVFWNQLLPVTDPLTSCGSSVVMLALQILRFIVFLNLKITPM